MKRRFILRLATLGCSVAVLGMGIVACTEAHAPSPTATRTPAATPTHTPALTATPRDHVPGATYKGLTYNEWVSAYTAGTVKYYDLLVSYAVLVLQMTEGQATTWAGALALP